MLPSTEVPAPGGNHVCFADKLEDEVGEEEEVSNSDEPGKTLSRRVRAPFERAWTSRTEMLEKLAEQLTLDEVQAGKVSLLRPSEHWGCLRRQAFLLLRATFPKSDMNAFDTFMGIAILYNVIVMVFETDATADCKDDTGCVSLWIDVSNNFLLVLYTLEVVLRLVVEYKDFFTSRWNLLDLSIVLCGLLSVALQDVQEFKRVSVLRLLRVARVIRVAKVMKRFPMLMNMINGFKSAMQAMVWGFILILILLLVWSLMAVELLYPISQRLDLADDDYCKDAFKSVLRSILTFFQNLVAGDSWGLCSVAIIQEEPATFLLFASSLVTVQLGFTNLVLAVIVDKAAEARSDNVDQKKQERTKAEERSLEMWRQVLQLVDAEGKGCITEEELLTGYSVPIVQQSFDMMNISETDLSMLFKLLDSDNSGTLSYEEFVESIQKAQTQDSRLYLMTMQLRMRKLEAQLKLQLDGVSGQMGALQTQMTEMRGELRHLCNTKTVSM